MVQPYLGFPQKLSNAIDNPVGLTWTFGNVGPWKTLLNYLESPAFKSAQQDCAKLQPNGGHPQPLSATQREAALRFSQCMRSHGISAFPDPSFSGARVQMEGNRGSGVDPQSPAFQAAQKACGKIFGGAPSVAKFPG